MGDVENCNTQSDELVLVSTNSISLSNRNRKTSARCWNYLNWRTRKKIADYIYIFTKLPNSMFSGVLVMSRMVDDV